MNLSFFTIDGVGRVEFPFQTPTYLTYSVLKAGTDDERLLLIEQYLREQKWEEPHIQKTIRRILELMQCPYLKLDLI
jgi:hypothetical protein